MVVVMEIVTCRRQSPRCVVGAISTVEHVRQHRDTPSLNNQGMDHSLFDLLVCFAACNSRRVPTCSLLQKLGSRSK